MSEIIRLNINGAEYRLNAEGAAPLLFIVRQHLELNGTRFGCPANA